MDYITYQYNKDLFFKLAKLTFERFDDESFQYIFKPYYDIIDSFDDIDIPGIDLSIQREEYYRVNLTPVFITKRVVPKYRVNLHEVLNELGLDYYQSFLLA